MRMQCFSMVFSTNRLFLDLRENHSIISDEFDTTMHSCIICRINFLSWRIQKKKYELHILHEDCFIYVSQTNLSRWYVLCNKMEYLCYMRALHAIDVRRNIFLSMNGTRDEKLCIALNSRISRYISCWAICK